MVGNPPDLDSLRSGGHEGATRTSQPQSHTVSPPTNSAGNSKQKGNLIRIRDKKSGHTSKAKLHSSQALKSSLNSGGKSSETLVSVLDRGKKSTQVFLNETSQPATLHTIPPGDNCLLPMTCKRKLCFQPKQEIKGIEQDDSSSSANVISVRSLLQMPSFSSNSHVEKPSIQSSTGVLSPSVSRIPLTFGRNNIPSSPVHENSLSSTLHPPSADHDMVITLSSSPARTPPNIWIPALDLYTEDKVTLESTSWLNDGIIYAAQSLLRDETKGQVNGWQSTQCSRNEGSFKVIPPKKPFIQILLVANCHWAVCSNIDTKDGGCRDSISYYDSARPTCLSTKVKETICSFYKCKANTLHFDIVNIEGQMNSYDCGVYAVAIATELAFKNDPTLCRWDCPKMRPHLLQCLENGKMSRFPTIGKRRIAFGSRVRKSYLHGEDILHL